VNFRPLHHDRFLPDKAIDVLDEAGSRARISTMTRPPESKTMSRDRGDQRQKRKASRQDFEAHADADQEKQAKEKLETLLLNWRKAGEGKSASSWTRMTFCTLSQKDGHSAQAHGPGRDAAVAPVETEMEKIVVGR